MFIDAHTSPFDGSLVLAFEAGPDDIDDGNRQNCGTAGVE